MGVQNGCNTARHREDEPLGGGGVCGYGGTYVYLSLGKREEGDKRREDDDEERLTRVGD